MFNRWERLSAKNAIQIENKQRNIQHYQIDAVRLPAERSTNSRADKKQPTVVDTTERKDNADHINQGG